MRSDIGSSSKFFVIFELRAVFAGEGVFLFMLSSRTIAPRLGASYTFLFSYSLSDGSS